MSMTANLKTLHLLTRCFYDDYAVLGIYSTPAKAKLAWLEFKNTNTGYDQHLHRIMPLEVDDKAKDRA